MTQQAMSYKLALTSQALATLGVDLRWDAAISDFLRKFSIMEADREFGAHAAAMEAYAAATIDLQNRFGKGWRDHPDAQAELREAIGASNQAEDAHDDCYLFPYILSVQRLAQTPAPSLAAATFKQLLIQAEEIHTNLTTTFNCMEIVADDFERLAPAIEGAAAVC